MLHMRYYVGILVLLCWYNVTCKTPTQTNMIIFTPELHQVQDLIAHASTY